MESRIARDSWSLPAHLDERNGLTSFNGRPVALPCKTIKFHLYVRKISLFLAQGLETEYWIRTPPELPREHARRAIGTIDVTVADPVKARADAIVEKFGGLNNLVSNAEIQIVNFCYRLFVCRNGEDAFSSRHFLPPR